MCGIVLWSPTASYSLLQHGLTHTFFFFFFFFSPAAFDLMALRPGLSKKLKIYTLASHQLKPDTVSDQGEVKERSRREIGGVGERLEKDVSERD